MLKSIGRGLRYTRGLAGKAGTLLVTVAVSGCRSNERAASAAPGELAARMVAGTFGRPGMGDDVHYRLFIPPQYSEARRYPLVVYLHGGGSHGTDNVRHLSSVVAALLGPAQAIEPAFVLAPQDPKGDKWVTGLPGPPFLNYRQAERAQSATTALVLLGLTEIEEKYPIDTERIYLMGISAGATGTWDILTRNGIGRFAAGVPLTGANDPTRASAIATLPIWAFHGARDKTAPVENTRDMVKNLRALGSPIRYTEYPDVAHASWKRAVTEPELFRWLFAQRRGAKPRDP